MKTSSFWFKNEKQVMKKLGLQPTPQSGAGEIYKEDGYNDYIICQLKSTESGQIAVKKFDIEKLQHHADMDRKIPIFVLQFLNGPMLIATTPQELGNISKYLNNELFEKPIVEQFEIKEQKAKKVLKSASLTQEEIRNKLSVVEQKASQEIDFINTVFNKRKERSENKKWKR